ncbi:hypothetical protein RhiirC2_796134 [Rhizophagus irregularis]|uniref:Ubiquitin-like domain-containing protein n=1 Tax=Rhizophagus irregularis TaxID=588596 RepID=A0A2N1MA90_9GLOM|nr:hypothetical protein RhiirC2_796134 [Rhizophagus irregularis]
MTTTDNNDIISLNLRIHDNQNDNEIFVIEISRGKKVDSLKPIVKKRLAPLFDRIPSTKINLLWNHPNDEKRMQATTPISNYFTENLDENMIHIFVSPPPSPE